ncbi:DUF1648 domain-containing protein [Kitasatospora sp. LaBMicrA B282]|uniref:DUF1648 domain-containing protein n=1 Tax=Kitasatospora sp. LaBMicrA B282 TaxID=3420949 RepID=UPI003D0CEBB3
MSSTAVLIQSLVCLLLLAAAWLMPSFTTPTLPFGVRVPSNRVQAPVISEQRRSYRWWVGLAGGAVLAAGTAWGLRTGSPAASVLTVFAVLAVQLAGYLRAHRAIGAVKQREQWYQGVRQGVVADTSLRTAPGRFPWLGALPAALIVVATLVTGVVRYPSMPDRLPMHFNGPGHVDRFAAKSVGNVFAVVLAQLGLTLLLVLLTWLVFRARPDLDPARAKVTAGQYRLFRTRMAHAMLTLTTCFDLSLAWAAWQIWSGSHTLAVLPVLLPIVVGLAVVLWAALSSGQNGSRLRVAEQAPDAGPTTPPVEHQDDDRHWRLGGLFYLNREDSALFVPKRFGIGWTLNLANPGAVAFVVLLLGLAVGLPLLTR